jgi:hypothetical protein
MTGIWTQVLPLTWPQTLTLWPLFIHLIPLPRLTLSLAMVPYYPSLVREPFLFSRLIILYIYITFLYHQKSLKPLFMFVVSLLTIIVLLNLTLLVSL